MSVCVFVWLDRGKERKEEGERSCLFSFGVCLVAFSSHLHKRFLPSLVLLFSFELHTKPLCSLPR